MKTQESFGFVEPWRQMFPSRPAHTLQSHLEKSVVTLCPKLFQTYSKPVHSDLKPLGIVPESQLLTCGKQSVSNDVKRFSFKSFKLVLHTWHTSPQQSCGVTCAGRLKSNELTPEGLSEIKDFKVSIGLENE